MVLSRVCFKMMTLLLILRAKHDLKVKQISTFGVYIIQKYQFLQNFLSLISASTTFLIHANSFLTLIKTAARLNFAHPSPYDTTPIWVAFTLSST